MIAAGDGATIDLSNVHTREPFRRRSVLAQIALGVVSGFHADSYLVALDALLAHLTADVTDDPE